MNTLEKCIQAFRNTRRSMVQAAGALYEVHQTEAWKEQSESFSEFCEDVLKIKKAEASKLIALYSHYALEAGVSTEKLAEAGEENLYLAIGTGANPEEDLSKAMTLTVSELRDERREQKHGICEHPRFESWSKCSDCGKFFRQNL